MHVAIEQKHKKMKHVMMHRMLNCSNKNKNVSQAVRKDNENAEPLRKNDITICKALKP